MLEIDHLWMALVGVAVLAFVLADVVTTTLAVGAGRGPLSDLVARATKRVSRVGGANHRTLQVSGVLGAAAVPVVWVALTWLAFAIMFLADDDAVVVASSQAPAAALGRIAYAAGGLAGAGASLVAGTETWELVNNVAAIVGLGLVTLGLTYLFQVVTSVKSERAMASRIAALGSSPVEAVAAAHRCGDLGTLPSQLLSIASELASAAQGHLALPLLELFHSPDRDSAASVNLARFDEMLSIIAHALPDEHVPLVRSGRVAVDDFIGTIGLRREHAPAPPVPSLAPLRAVGADVVDDDTFRRRFAAESERRSRLRTYVESELWTWEDVAGEA